MKECILEKILAEDFSKKLNENKKTVPNSKQSFLFIDFSQLSTQSVRNIKPPAMRVRKRKFATKYTFHYNRVVQATINERKVFIGLIKLIARPILNGCVSII